MKVEMGPYKNFIGPYQIAEKILFWKDKYNSDEDRDIIFKFGEMLDRIPGLTKFCRWIDLFRKRKIKVRIDHYDTWGMDRTLALIILPMLKKLCKHGAPLIDDEDVPEELRSTSAPPKENEWDTDDNHFKRWEWVLEQMIWSFEQCVDETVGRNYYYDHYEEGEETQSSFISNLDMPEAYRRERGKFNKDKYKEYNDKVQVGLVLFGKYFRSLWD